MIIEGLIIKGLISLFGKAAAGAAIKTGVAVAAKAVIVHDVVSAVDAFTTAANVADTASTLGAVVPADIPSIPLEAISSPDILVSPDLSRLGDPVTQIALAESGGQIPPVDAGGGLVAEFDGAPSGSGGDIHGNGTFADRNIHGGSDNTTIHGGPGDATIHGGRPTDIQGNTKGNVYGPFNFG